MNYKSINKSKVKSINNTFIKNGNHDKASKHSLNFFKMISKAWIFIYNEIFNNEKNYHVNIINNKNYHNVKDTTEFRLIASRRSLL